MADEKLTLEVAGLSESLDRLGQLSAAVGRLGGGGVDAGGAIGMAGRFGRLAGAVGIAATAVAALAGAARHASDALMAMSGLADRLGGSGAQTAFLKMLGGALGIGDMGALADQLRAAGSSGLGAAEFARLGIPIRPPGIGTPPNMAEMTIKIAEGLRAAFNQAGGGQRGLDAARMMAERFGPAGEALLPTIRIQQELWEQIRRDSESAAKAYSPAAIDRAMRLRLQQERLSQSWEKLSVQLGSVTIPVVSKFMEALVDRPWQLGLFGLAGAFFGGGGKSAQAQATTQNTQALNKLASELRTTNGIFGGGPRARSAIPSAFGPGGGYVVDRVLRAQSIRLGAFAVSL